MPRMEKITIVSKAQTRDKTTSYKSVYKLAFLVLVKKVLTTQNIHPFLVVYLFS